MPFSTTHQLFHADARDMARLPDGSVDLVVTSPPYPMIEMWDAIFAAQAPDIEAALENDEPWAAFEGMHRVLDDVWKEIQRVMRPGGIACINIGDATRTAVGGFALYPNHARILNQLLQLGLSPLPTILWRKQTNAPNKFMGSGMYPPSAYVTLEHEYVLVVRNGDKRAFTEDADRTRRRESAYFWEERNAWFSDVWFDLKGTTQDWLGDASSKETRQRSAAYPFELPYRLIQMFSIRGDVVLDPFLGTGTTTLAAMASGRSSVGFERDEAFVEKFAKQTAVLPELADRRAQARFEAHAAFVQERFEKKGPFRHRNARYGFPVITRQEVDLSLPVARRIERAGETTFEVECEFASPREPVHSWDAFLAEPSSGADALPESPPAVAGSSPSVPSERPSGEHESAPPPAETIVQTEFFRGGE